MDARALAQDLGENTGCELLFDDASRYIYSTDASLYRIQPLGVALPRTRDDIAAVVEVAGRHGVPLLPRGGGTSLAGQTVSGGLVVDCSKYLNRVLKMNRIERWVEVEPGIVRDNLNDFLGFHGLFFTPDVATTSRANIGGMIGNNSSGSRSIHYGRTVESVLELTVVLAGGQQLRFGKCNREELDRRCGRDDFEGALYRRIREIIAANRREIQERFPKVLRRVGGYNLDLMLDEDDFNLARLITGSEGTLGFVTSARLALEPIPSSTAIAVLHFDDLLDAISAVPDILEHGPSAVEIMDRYGLQLAGSSPAVAGIYRSFIEGDPAAVQIVELSGHSHDQTQAALEGLKTDTRLTSVCSHIFSTTDVATQQQVWKVRKNALGVLLSTRGDAKPLPFIEDAAIPVEHLSRYIGQVLEICRRHDRPVALYAHASVGVIHVRPILNLKEPEDVRILRAIADEVFELVRDYGGAWSGEHGDGLVRSFKNREFFGDRLFEAFREVKAAFDPEGLMNPGKIVDLPDPTSQLRIDPDYRVELPETFFRFEDDQGFDGAVEMCTGVGACRKTLTGTMCPSYMATRDEAHSTRGRANALRAAISGELPGGLGSPQLHDVLDLCLECKACKSECPSSVDLARLKAETMAHYYGQHGWPVGKRLIANVRRQAELGSRAPAVTNLAAGNRLGRLLLERVAGIDRRRPLPKLSRQPLHRRQGWTDPEDADIMLLADTFTCFYEPDVGLAARRVLEAAGFSVGLSFGGCCGRPLISAGMLERARSTAGHLIETLSRCLEAGKRIIVLEPSCLSTIRDDLPDLALDAAGAARLAGQALTLEEVMEDDRATEALAAHMGGSDARIVLHGHCQQKALMGTDPTRRLLSLIPRSSIEVLDSGCCGMAGSFGYEKSHYGISEKIGAQRLFPAVKKAPADALVAAPGFSCRAQIAHFANRAALHPAQLLALFLDQPIRHAGRRSGPL